MIDKRRRRVGRGWRRRGRRCGTQPRKPVLCAVQLHCIDAVPVNVVQQGTGWYSPRHVAISSTLCFASSVITRFDIFVCNMARK